MNSGASRIPLVLAVLAVLVLVGVVAVASTGSTAARESAPATAWHASSGIDNAANEPPKRVKGVRAAATSTTSESL